MTEKKTALVTGRLGILGRGHGAGIGTRGIPRCRSLSSRQRLRQHVVESIIAAGGEALAVPGRSIADSESVALLFEHIEQHFGPVDCLVNNAGINRDVLLAFMSEEQWDEVIDTNLRADLSMFAARVDWA